MRALDLFSGTESVARVLSQHYEVDTLDIEARFEPARVLKQLAVSVPAFAQFLAIDDQGVELS